MASRYTVVSGWGVGFGAALTMLVTALLNPSAARADLLYRLQTRCSLEGAAPVACSVEASNHPVTPTGGVTLYRHTIGNERISVRISDGPPVRMERWDALSQRWQSLSSAAARFSSNTICFNGRALCVINPNYLNSVRQDNPAAMARRDLVRVRFGSDGRIHASCYDEGCEETLR